MLIVLIQGISLSMDQFNALMGVLPQMIDCLEGHDIQVVHPSVKPAKGTPEAKDERLEEDSTSQEVLEAAPENE